MTRGIYRIRCLITGKSYIGRAESIERRWSEEHLPSLRKDRHHSQRLQRSWNKYGESNFVLEVIEEIPERALQEVEQRYLDQLWGLDLLLNTNNKAVGGSSPGSRSQESRKRTGDALRGRSLSEDHREKLRQRALEREPRPPPSEATRQKLSLAGKGRKLSQEVRDHLSRVRRGKKISPMSERGRQNISKSKSGRKTGPVSEERREQMRQISLGRKLTPEQREKVRQAKLEYWRKKREEKRD